MVQVRISETYDLSTKINKMGIVGIHTPTGGLIDKMWSGLVLQYRKFRFVKCDVAMACASMLPADPLQVGVEAGTIAPQDMFNPILYRAVSNDSMNNILSFLRNAEAVSGVSKAYDKGSIVSINDAQFAFADGATTDADQFSMYYSMLADTNGWRKAMPQSGLAMNGLYPLVYQVVSQYGINGPGGYLDSNSTEAQVFGPSAVAVGGDPPSTAPLSKDGVVAGTFSQNLRGRAMRMPSINTVVYTPQADVEDDVVPNERAFVQSNTGQVPPAYVGLIVLPPAKLNQLYYRLKVTWTIEFSDLRALSDIMSWASMYYAGQDAYGTDYAEQSTAMTAKTSMVDTSGADINKIMEGS